MNCSLFRFAFPILGPMKKTLVNLFTFLASSVPTVSFAFTSADLYGQSCNKKIDTSLNRLGYYSDNLLSVESDKKKFFFRWNDDQPWAPCSGWQYGSPEYKCGSAVAFDRRFDEILVHSKDGERFAANYISGAEEKCSLRTSVPIKSKEHLSFFYDFSAIYKYQIKDPRAGGRSFYIREVWAGIEAPYYNGSPRF